jgi:hypothetical protein
MRWRSYLRNSHFGEKFLIRPVVTLYSFSSFSFVKSVIFPRSASPSLDENRPGRMIRRRP